MTAFLRATCPSLCCGKDSGAKDGPQRLCRHPRPLLGVGTQSRLTSTNHLASPPPSPPFAGIPTAARCKAPTRVHRGILKRKVRGARGWSFFSLSRATTHCFHPPLHTPLPGPLSLTSAAVICGTQGPAFPEASPRPSQVSGGEMRGGAGKSQ